MVEDGSKRQTKDGTGEEDGGRDATVVDLLFGVLLWAGWVK